MASIKDVARLAGVSVMTASRVVNQNGSASPAAHAAVMRAVKELDYRPNLTARSLRVQRSHLLGLLIPDIENPIFAAMAKHVEGEAKRHGYDVMLGNTWEDVKREADLLEIMQLRQMDGIIILPVSGENGFLIGNCGVPVVVLDRAFGGIASPPSVKVDNLEVGRLAARHFLSLKHKRFACVTGPLHIEVFANRFEGFKSVLAEAGLGIDMLESVEITGTVGYGEAAGDKLFERPFTRPLALFCANDMTALGAMKSAVRHGLRIPEDVSIIGVDDIPAGELATPSLTTVRQPIGGMAAMGVKVLMKMLRKEEEHPDDIVLPPELVPRESTKKYSRTAASRPKMK